MNTTKKLKRIFSIFLALALLLCQSAEAEEPTDLSDYTLLDLPATDYASLYPEDIVRHTAIALRMYFMDISARNYDYFDDIWNRKMVILSDPYILKVDYLKDDDLMIYCCSTISAYRLNEYGNGYKCFEEFDYTIGVFRINITYEEGGELTVGSVYRVGDMKEELYPGSGNGEDGFPGLSSILLEEMGDDSRGFTTKRIAQMYLDMNHLDAEIDY